MHHPDPNRMAKRALYLPEPHWARLDAYAHGRGIPATAIVRTLVLRFVARLDQRGGVPHNPPRS